MRWLLVTVWSSEIDIYGASNSGAAIGDGAPTRTVFPGDAVGTPAEV
jgi:hypothetical protein